MASDNSTVHLVEHPLVQHKITLMRRKDASTNTFRRLVHEVSALMAYEVLRDVATHEVDVDTPLERTTGRVIDGKKLVFASILRAGTGILDGMLEVVPSARVGHIGLYRDPKTLVVVEYYFKMPADLPDRDVIVVDPMLATGHSAVAALDRIAECRASEDCPADDEKLDALEERLTERLAKLEACSSGEGECDMPKKPHGRNPHLKDRLTERFQRA